MARAVHLREDYSAVELRRLAKRTKLFIGFSCRWNTQCVYKRFRKSSTPKSCSWIVGQFEGYGLQPVHI